MLEFLHREANAYGVEYEMKKVAKFQQEHPDIADRVRQGDIEAMDFPDAWFDVAMVNEVLEHVPNEQRALYEAYRVLKPGGHLVVFSPNRFFPFESHGVYWKTTGKRVPVYAPLIPYIPLKLGQHFFRYWARNYWPWELQSMVRSVGFEICHTDFIWQTFENISRHQNSVMRQLQKPMRALATTLETIPIIKTLGVTQVILARKPVSLSPA